MIINVLDLIFTLKVSKTRWVTLQLYKKKAKIDAGTKNETQLHTVEVKFNNSNLELISPNFQ